MSELSRAARRAMKAKAHRMASSDPHQKVDASSWTEAEPLNTETKTGMRPVSPRQYKRGGKVHGEAAHHHAGHKARKAGGRGIGDSLINRDQKEANRERPGGNDHIGGYKKGGRLHRMVGGMQPGGPGPIAGPILAGGPMTPQAGPGQAASAPPVSSPAPPIPPPVTMPPVVGGGPLAPAISQGLGGGQGRFSFGYPQASSLAQRLGIKTGGRAKHADEREDEELIRREVKPEALKRRHGGRARAAWADEYMRGGEAKEGGGEHWIAGAIKHPGALHRELGVPQGEKIPAKKLAKAKHSDNPVLRKRAELATTLGRMHKAGGGSAYGDDDEDQGYFSGAPKTASDSHMIRAIKDHGQNHTYINGVLHGLDRDSEGNETPYRIGNSVSRLKNFLGYAKGGSVSDGELEGTRPLKGGRMAHAKGGKAGKGKMNVNIIIGAGHGAQDAQTTPGGMLPPGGPPRPPGGVPVPMPPTTPPMGGGMMPMPIPMPMGAASAPPPMGGTVPRKRGGRTVASEMAEAGAGAGSGLGRLEKIKAYGRREARRDSSHY